MEHEPKFKIRIVPADTSEYKEGWKPMKITVTDYKLKPSIAGPGVFNINYTYYEGPNKGIPYGRVIPFSESYSFLNKKQSIKVQIVIALNKLYPGVEVDWLESCDGSK